MNISPPGATAAISGLVTGLRFDDVPQSVIAKAKGSILDALGVTLAGSATDSAAILRDYAAEVGRDGAATVIGTPLRLAPPLAALVNGTAGHIDDFDDTLRSSVTAIDKGSIHPTVPIFAAVLAVGEAKGISGRDAMAAYLAGVEAVSRIADALGERHFQSGFHNTATCGSLGAAVAAARALGLPRERVAVALGIAASGAAGLRDNFGTMMKPYHEGAAARTGVMAAELAARGFTASETILEASRGFFSAYGDGYDPAWLDRPLGDPWAFDSPGVWIKPYPSGMRTHPGMSAIAALRAEHGLTPDEVESIGVRTNQSVYNTLLHHRPKAGLQGKFSMEYCLAAVLTEGRASLDAFTDAEVGRADLQDLLRRVDYEAYDAAEAQAAGYNNVTTLLELRLRDGRTLTARADSCKGSGDDPMSYAEIAAKVTDAAVFRGWPADRMAALTATVATLETLDDIGALGRVLRPE
jgi:2-methylcitrate dehydratase PrpD